MCVVRHRDPGEPEVLLVAARSAAFGRKPDVAVTAASSVAAAPVRRRVSGMYTVAVLDCRPDPTAPWSVSR
ncbi:hypothetical protein ACFQZZ_30735 [Nocardia sp. GCM10030253]|uniref:hypothetical protein n=1 Tax=Nocardia sp. GCM10030253 TaxID=3273404 RepID=UPI003644CFB9